jgi:hypothetical protein
MIYPASIVQECESLWTDFFEPALGKRAANQFRRAMKRQHNAFADHFISPHLFCPDLGEGLYVPVDNDKFTEGRNHLLAEALAATPSGRFPDSQLLTALSYFANPLRIGVQHPDPFDEEHLVWESPEQPRDPGADPGFHLRIRPGHRVPWPAIGLDAISQERARLPHGRALSPLLDLRRLRRGSRSTIRATRASTSMSPFAPSWLWRSLGPSAMRGQRSVRD